MSCKVKNLNIADAYNVSIQDGGGLAEIENFSIAGCSAVYEFVFDTYSPLRITLSFSVDGDNNLTMSGDVIFGGSESNSVFTDTEIKNSDASGGASIYALNNCDDGGGNTNWFFALVETTSYIGNDDTDFEGILVPAVLTQEEFDIVEAAGRLYHSVEDWITNRGGDLTGEFRKEVGQVVETLLGNQKIENGADSAGWRYRESERTWYKIVSSQHNKYQVATTYGSDALYYSSDFGETWSNISPAGTQAFYSVAISGDGQTITAVSATSGSARKIFVSRDSGGTWDDTVYAATTRQLTGLAMSRDATVQLARSLESEMLISIDSGATWNLFTPTLEFPYESPPVAPARVSPFIRKIKCISISEDGEYILMTQGGQATVTSTPYAVADYGGRFWVLKRNGTTGNADGRDWEGKEFHTLNGAVGGTAIETSDFQGCSMSDDGHYMAVTSRTNGAFADAIPTNFHKIGKIFVSSDHGVTWTDARVDVPTDIAIESSTNATPISINSTGHGLQDYDEIRISGHATNTPVNNTWVIRKVDDDNFTLWRTWASTLIASVGTAIGSGGTGSVQREWYPVAVSGDGSIMYAGIGVVTESVNSGHLWKSTDHGVTWTESDGVQARYWQSLALSEDGLKLSAAIYAGYIQVLGGETNEECYFKLEPIPTLDRFVIDKSGDDDRGLDIFMTSYTRVINCDVHNGEAGTDDSMTGIWSQTSSFVQLINPRTYDLRATPATTGSAVGGIHVSGYFDDEDNCSGCIVINPVVYDINGKNMAQGIYIQGRNHVLIGATVYDVDVVDNPLYPSGGIVITGDNNTVKNCIAIAASVDDSVADFNDLSVGLIANKNVASDGSAPGTTTIQDAAAANEWVSPGADFHLKSEAQVRGFGELVPEYAYDFDGNVRG